MKKIDTQFVTGTEGQPLLAASIDHLQEAYKEAIAAIVKGLVNPDNSTVPLILFGLENTGSGSSYVFAAGAIYYNDEIYLVDSTSFTVTTGVPIINFVTTNAAIDPILFESGASHSVHKIAKIAIVEGTSGTGNVTSSTASDYSNIKRHGGSTSYTIPSGKVSLSSGSVSSINGTIVYRKVGNMLFFTMSFSLVASSTGVQYVEINLDAIIKTAYDNSPNFPVGIGQLQITTANLAGVYYVNDNTKIMHIECVDGSDLSSSTTIGVRGQGFIQIKD